jgi:phosphoglycolate phosphatase
MKYRSLLFDWSGTLVDDLPPTLHATNTVLAGYDVPAMSREEFRLRFRLPYPEFYEEVLPGVAIGDLEDTFRSSFNESPQGVTVLPHAREMLSWCREQGIRCFVLSSMDVGLFTEQAHDFGLYDHFEAIYAGVIDKREQHGGIDSIAVATGYDSVEKLVKSGPSQLFEHLGEFREWLTNPKPGAPILT